MARPQKTGLDYFSFDVCFFEDIKIRKISHACGINSYSILICLLCNIYRDHGYYILWDEDLPFVVADKVGTSEGAVEEVIKKALQVNLFSKDAYEKHKILTSHGIQKRYLSATLRRGGGVIADKFRVSDDNNIISVCRNPTKESKVKESKEKDVTDVTSKKKDLNPVISEPEETHPPVAPPPLPNPDFEKFQKWILEKAPRVAKMEEPFTEEEYLRIKEEFPPGMTAEVLLAMHNSKDLLKKNLSANLTFRNWIKRRQNDGKNANNRKPDKASDEEFARGLAATALRLEYESLDKGHITPDEFKRRTGIEPLPRQARNY